MTIRRWILILAPIAGLCIGCGNPVAGGGSSGSEAGNSLFVRLVRPDSSPVVGARVRIRVPNYLRQDSLSFPIGQIRDSSFVDVVTDTDGTAMVRGLRGGSYRLEVLQKDSATQTLATVTPGREMAAHMVLTPAGGLCGRMPPGREGAWVGILGTDQRVRSDLYGFFSLGAVPVGALGVHALDGSEQGFQIIKSRQASSVGVVRPEQPKQLFLDDFEDGDTQNRYEIFTGWGAWWYWVRDSNMVGSHYELDSLPSRGIATDTSPWNRYLHYGASPRKYSKGTTVEINVSLARVSVDLRALQSITFRSRGSGTVNLRIESRHLAKKQFIQATASLTSTWSYQTVPLSSFQLVGSGTSGLSIPALLDSCPSLTWSLKPSQSLDLDDVQMTGVDPQSLWGPLVLP